MVPGAAAASGFDDETMGSGGGGGGSSGASSNRWPREETQALIRIRSEMDATFRDATLKGPLWEDVSRKLADLGYKRSAKKCKEKFENVHKYYKRTKEGRAGRQDGKSYRFFEELEALHAAAPQPPPQHLPAASTAPQLHALAAPVSPTPQQQLPASSAAPPLHAFPAPVSAPPPLSSMPLLTGPMQPAPISSAAPAPAPVDLLVAHQPLNLQGFSFSSMSDSESDDESEDDDMTAETGGNQDRLGKRKRGDGGGSSSNKMMSFFEGLMQQVVDRQEEMQRRFLETMEKREAERTAREEAWRRQEVARLNREQEQLAQERAAAASRDAAIIAFLQRIGGQSVQPPATAVVVPMPAPVSVHTTPPKQPSRQQQQPPPPSPQAGQATPQSKPISAAPLQQQPPQQQPKDTSQQDAGTPRSLPPASSQSLELVPVAATEHHVDSGLGGGDGGAASSSRWPKTEVHALIQLRMDLDMRYQETGPKGPLWEDISSGMRRLGYNRSSKRCKEKWENINKYYKKVKESNKKRPEDSKTCPYFHQLEAIYNRKHLRSLTTAATSSAAAAPRPAYPDQLNPSRQEIEGKNINDDKRNNGGSGGGTQVPTSNGETATTTTTTTLVAFDADTGMKKPEDIVRELNEHPRREFTTEDETDSDDMGDEYTDDGEEGEDDGKMQYRIQFQRPNPGGTNTAPAPAAATTAAPAVPTSAPTSTFLAMVQ